jgi:hypothetical protein
MCVRKWICEQSIRDEALREELLTGACAMPLRVGKFELAVGAEFRSKNLYATPAADCAPFRMSAVAGGDAF